jgi:hypothetical protein
MFKRLKYAVIASWLMLSMQSAHAIIIEADAEFLMGDKWEVTYTVTNNNLASLDYFSIYYDFGLFDNLEAKSGPTGWIVEVFQVVGGFANSEGIIDFFLESGTPLGQGESLGEFTVRFDYLGDGSPFEFFAEVYDGNFNFLEDGLSLPITFVPSSPPGQVSEPGTIVIMLVGSLFLLFRRKALL